MDKMQIMKAVIAELEGELRRQLKGQRSAAEGATHAEARAETKWDTCGLEQSYLARGLAKQVEGLALQVEELRSFVPAGFAGKAIDVGALVEAEMNGGELLFFLLSCGGGTELTVQGKEIAVITPQSPVGAALIGRREGDAYSFRAGMVGKIRRVE